MYSDQRSVLLDSCALKSVLKYLLPSLTLHSVVLPHPSSAPFSTKVSIILVRLSMASVPSAVTLSRPCNDFCIDVLQTSRILYKDLSEAG